MLPFKWNFNVITNLPLDMIDALESIHPFIIGIQKGIWESHCLVEMMDNIKEENFVILDVDEGKTRGLTDIYGSENLASFHEDHLRELRSRYFQLWSEKDDLIAKVTQGTASPRSQTPNNIEPKKGYSGEKA